MSYYAIIACSGVEARMLNVTYGIENVECYLWHRVVDDGQVTMGLVGGG